MILRQNKDGTWSAYANAFGRRFVCDADSRKEAMIACRIWLDEVKL